MHRFLRRALVATTLTVAACDPVPVTKIVTFGLAPSTSEQRTAAARILAARFNRKWSEIRVLEDSIVIEWRGDAPDDSDFQSIGNVQGIYRVSPADSKHLLLFSDLDIENVTLFSSDEDATLDVELTERAGAKMEEFTRRNVGSVLVTTLDRKEISRAKISGIFGRRFQTTGLDPPLARTLAVILRHGRLPVAVRKVDIQNSID